MRRVCSECGIRRGCFHCRVGYGSESKRAIKKCDRQSPSNHSSPVTRFVLLQWFKPKLLVLVVYEKIAVNINIFCRVDYFIFTILYNNCPGYLDYQITDSFETRKCVQIRITIF